jgi:hypothetical protein
VCSFFPITVSPKNYHFKKKWKRKGEKETNFVWPGAKVKCATYSRRPEGHGGGTVGNGWDAMDDPD